jgi:hypothetical protein
MRKHVGNALQYTNLISGTGAAAAHYKADSPGSVAVVGIGHGQSLAYKRCGAWINLP